MLFLHKLTPKKENDMKKRYFILMLMCVLLNVKSVSAKDFNLTSDGFKAFHFYWYENNEDNNYRKCFRHLTNDLGISYFDISPQNYFDTSKDYYLETNLRDLNLLENISHNMYYGNQVESLNATDKYFLTQYLIYKVFPKYILNITDDSSAPIDYLQEEIKKITTKLEEETFTIKDLKIEEYSLTIKDAYILNEFAITGDNVTITKEENQTTLTFEPNLPSYTLNFTPKNDCQNAEVYGNATSYTLFGADQVCGNPHQITIRSASYIEEEPEKTKTNAEIKENNEEDLEITEVNVPDTYQVSILPLFYLFCFGNLYTYFKK